MSGAEMSQESMHAAQVQTELARFGLRPDCSVATLVAVAQGIGAPESAYLKDAS